MNVRQIPGMKPESSVRNLFIGAVYLALTPIFMILLPVLLFLAPALVGIVVWKDWRGLADYFGSLPGVSEVGGLKSGILAWTYTGIIASFVLGGIVAAIGTGGETSSNPEVEASGGTTLGSNLDAGGDSPTTTSQESPTTEAKSEIPAYSPVQAEDLSYSDTDRTEVSVKLAESRPQLTEEEARLIGEDVVEPRKEEADVIYVQIYQPKGEIGAGACASIEWTEETGYDITISRISCTDPEW